MLKLDLDREEREVLVDLLETNLADLRMEIGDSVPLAYRDMLRKKKKVLEKTVACLRRERFLRVEPMDPKVPRV
ncbi:MAG: hypothetical protein RRA15_12875 [bacterium]|nr:hypothetical protein [bacterium]MDT8367355.1 hypothetical protein [bacterium]